MSEDERKGAQVTANMAANFAGHLWTAVMGLLCVPLYVKFMGVESYGLFSLCSAVMSLLLVLDLGLSTVAIREAARLSAIPGKVTQLRSMVRTLEYIYWAFAAVIAAAVFATSHWIAFRWIRPEQLAGEDVRQAVLLMGIAIACRLPSRLYTGVLQGLQRQVLLNGIIALASGVRSVGAVLVLWLISPTIQAFLICQAAGDLIETLATMLCLSRILPESAIRVAPNLESLGHLWRFSAGMAGVTVLYTALSQMDKLVLSSLVSLKVLGYYSLASVAAAALLKLLVPIETAVFPRFAELISLGDAKRLEQIYHQASQLVSVAIIPACAVLVIFPKEVLLLWTGDYGTAVSASAALSLLALATGIQGLTGVPVSVQLAHGWTTLVVGQTAISLAIGVPLMILLTVHFGIVGTAVVWLVLHTGEFLVTIRLMHRRILLGQYRAWCGYDVGLPALAAFGTAICANAFIPEPTSRLLILAALALVLAASLVAAGLTVPVIRQAISALIAMARSHRGSRSGAG